MARKKKKKPEGNEISPCLERGNSATGKKEEKISTGNLEKRHLRTVPQKEKSAKQTLFQLSQLFLRDDGLPQKIKREFLL